MISSLVEIVENYLALIEQTAVMQEVMKEDVSMVHHLSG